MFDDLWQITRGLDRRFPHGRDPSQIITRLAEECGELAREVNHFEGSSVKHEKHGSPDRRKLAKEVQDVRRCALQIAAYYDIRWELENSIEASYRQVRAKGLLN